jgi:N-acetylglucosamine-6-phosphate deacetylase
VATIVTSPRERIVRSLKIIAAARREDPDIAAAVPGIHIEGPFISSEEGPRGAHDTKHIRDPSVGEFDEWQEAAEGRIVMVTMAPERSGGIDFVRALTERGVVVSIGHTAASPEIIREAISAGARFSTHLGNGSHAMIPRHKNYIWEQLAADELSIGLIPDGFHLPYSALKALARAKGYDKTVLVSDVSRMGGMEPGVYHWGAVPVRVYDDGHLQVVDTPFLAGAGHLLDWSIAQFLKATGCSLADALAMCTKNPASICGFDSGSLAVGKPAHITLFYYTKGSDTLQVKAVWRNGVEVYTGESAG